MKTDEQLPGYAAGLTKYTPSLMRDLELDEQPPRWLNDVEHEWEDGEEDPDRPACHPNNYGGKKALLYSPRQVGCGLCRFEIDCMEAAREEAQEEDVTPTPRHGCHTLYTGDWPVNYAPGYDKDQSACGRCEHKKSCEENLPKPRPKETKMNVYEAMREAGGERTRKGWVIPGDLDLTDMGLTKLPPLYKVGGSLHIFENNLKNLIGCPKEVETLDCCNNPLDSWEGAPEVVGDLFIDEQCDDDLNTNNEDWAKKYGKSLRSVGTLYTVEETEEGGTEITEREGWRRHLQEHDGQRVHEEGRAAPRRSGCQSRNARRRKPGTVRRGNLYAL